MATQGENVARRYIFKLYPTTEQAAALHEHRMMVADLWNALLERHETIRRRTVQRATWFDADGKRHVGESTHSLTWSAQRFKSGEIVTVEAGANGRPKSFTAYDMQNEVTWLANAMPEWRAVSIWMGHRTAQLLDRAFQAFYRRARNGDGASSGYPRFRRRQQHDGIPHRFLSGCALRQSPRHAQSWELRLKGVPGIIHARGRLPVPTTDFTDADVLWRAGRWWLSAACNIERERDAGRWPMTIRFGVLDGMAEVDGIVVTPPELTEAAALDDRADRMKAERDIRWPRGRRRSEEQAAYREASAEIAQTSAIAARKRRNALHVWTARLIARASDITIIMPPTRRATASPRGDKRGWGAEVETVSTLNRATLSYAPATAAQMLKYKAEEAGIRCDIVAPEASEIDIGRELVQAGRQARRTRRALKEEAVA
jgi:hypothetical protein